ncbi:hypothetical protein ACH49O_36385 [Streptomyces coeruleorubidus]|uniref:hypothetical protein n=1 Tax=Streptomyces coeruleorubidus TaxID=116188 RepID=UPI00340ADFA8
MLTTRALLTARENITDTVAARTMMCIHGGAGSGKTLAVNICLRALEPGEDVRRDHLPGPAHRPRGAPRTVHRPRPGR